MKCLHERCSTEVYRTNLKVLLVRKNQCRIEINTKLFRFKENVSYNKISRFKCKL